MSHGQRRSMISNTAGRDYWNKVDKIFGPGAGHYASVSHKSKTNKLTKRHTHKSIRQKIKQFVKSIKEEV